MEPSWLPHTPVILYIKGSWLFELFFTTFKEKSEVIKQYVSKKKRGQGTAKN